MSEQEKNQKTAEEQGAAQAVENEAAAEQSKPDVQSEHEDIEVTHAVDSESVQNQTGEPAQEVSAGSAEGEPASENNEEVKRSVSVHAAAEEEKPVAGAPVEEETATETEVMRAVSRSGDVPGPKRVGGAEVPESREVSLAEMPLIDDDLLAAAAGKSEEGKNVGAPAAPEVTQESESASKQAILGAPGANNISDSFFTDVPEQPELRGNRGAGFLIAILATVAFMIVHAGVIALWLAPHFYITEFLTDGLLPQVLSVSFFASAIAFFIGLVLIVFVCGKAGWWAYVLGGFLVGALTWLASVGGQFVQDRYIDGERVVHSIPALFEHYGVTVWAIIAGVVAREVVVWFGAWIGARGRRIKRENRQAVAEYEEAVAAAQQKSGEAGTGTALGV